MGMDVYGKMPTEPRGEYFRNNVWWWRPLWDYCTRVAPDLCAQVEGQYNSGDGLNAIDAMILGVRLQEELDSGGTAEFKKEYYEYLSTLPREDCSLCKSTGVRRDAVGVREGMHERELPEEVQILVGRKYGTCNGCSGYGSKPPFACNYPFSEENVQEFALFLQHSGGFEIW